jgi:hypothetical protein
VLGHSKGALFLHWLLEHKGNKIPALQLRKLVDTVPVPVAYDSQRNGDFAQDLPVYFMNSGTDKADADAKPYLQQQLLKLKERRC